MKKEFILSLLMLWVLVTFAGCDNSGCGKSDSPGGVDNNLNYTLPGEYSLCNYTDGLSDSRYHSARMDYPCAESGIFGATTLVSGGMKEDSLWIAEHLVSHGIVVLSITPNFSEIHIDIYTNAQKGGIFKLRSENSRRDSPVYHKINTDYLQVLGADIGGGGALVASADLRNQVRSTIAVNPEMVSTSDVKYIDSSVALITSMGEERATDGAVKNLIDNMPWYIKKAYIEFGGPNIEWKYPDPQIKAQIVYWTKFFFTDGDIAPIFPTGAYYFEYNNGAGATSAGSSSGG